MVFIPCLRMIRHPFKFYITSIRLTNSCSRFKHRKRKPTWLPRAPSKFYNIPEHPYVPPEEKELISNLLEEYYRKIESLRKLFQDELKQMSQELKIEKESVDDHQEFQLLLKENQKENERIKIIREKTLENDLQTKHLELLELYEKQKEEQAKLKVVIEETVRKAKEEQANLITYDNLEQAIENALDNPVDVNFAITTNGDVIWEGMPPSEFKEEIMQNIGYQRANIK